MSVRICQGIVFNESGIDVVNLHENLLVMLHPVTSEYLQMVGQLLFRNLQKIVVILYGNRDVNVVVPRDESMMTNCPEACSSDREIRYIVLLT